MGKALCELKTMRWASLLLLIVASSTSQLSHSGRVSCTRASLGMLGSSRPPYTDRRGKRRYRWRNQWMMRERNALRASVAHRGQMQRTLQMLVQSFSPAMATPPPCVCKISLPANIQGVININLRTPKLASRRPMSNKSSAPFTEIFAERRNSLLHPFPPQQLKASDQWHKHNV